MAYLSLVISEQDLKAINAEVEAKKAINRSDYVRQAIREKQEREKEASQ